MPIANAGPSTSVCDGVCVLCVLEARYIFLDPFGVCFRESHTGGFPISTHACIISFKFRPGLKGQQPSHQALSD